jgi:hypothetical protein
LTAAQPLDRADQPFDRRPVSDVTWNPDLYTNISFLLRYEVWIPDDLTDASVMSVVFEERAVIKNH